MKWIATTKRAIEETDDIPIRLELIEEAEATAVAAGVPLAEKHDALRRERGNAVSNSTSQAPYASLKVSLVTLAAVLVAADVPLQHLLTRVGFPSLSRLAVLIAAPCIAVGFAAGVHAVAHVATFDPIRPRRSLRICLTLAAVFGVVATAALTLILFARTASPDAVPYIATLVGVALWVLGESLPIIAGFISAGAHIMFYPEIHDRRVRRLEARIAEIDRFLEWLTREKSRLSAPEQAEYPPARSSIASAAIASAIAVCILLGNPNFADAADITAHGRAGSCAILLDPTASVSPEARKAAVERLLPTVPEFIRAFQCQSLRVGTFADEGVFAPTIELQPPAPLHKVECGNAPLEAANGMHQLLRGMAAFQVHDHRVAEKKCMDREAVEQAQYAEEERKMLNEVSRVLDPGKPARGRCTALRGALDGLLHARTRISVLITDAAETCSKKSGSVEGPSDAAVIFVLLRSRGEPYVAGENALSRATDWQKIVPNLRIILPQEIVAGSWAELATAALPQPEPRNQE